MCIDIIFKQPCDLKLLYDEIVLTTIFTVKPDNIATFLGQRIICNCKKEVRTNYNQHILSTRIKRRIGDVSIKMYDMFDRILQIETTCNGIGTFRVKQKTEHRYGSLTEQKAPLKKIFTACITVSSVHNYKSYQHRYLEFISSFDDYSNCNGNVTNVIHLVKEKERFYCGLNFCRT